MSKSIRVDLNESLTKKAERAAKKQGWIVGGGGSRAGEANMRGYVHDCVRRCIEIDLKKGKTGE